MRRVALALIGTVTGLVMLLTFKTRSTDSTAAVATSTENTGTGAGPGSGATSASPSPSTGRSGSKTLTGDAVDTRFGPVQVQITLQNGKITSVTAVEYPTSSPLDREINADAIPQLNQEALTAQSAQIDAISGATYTSNGYTGSLQSALDKAGV